MLAILSQATKTGSVGFITHKTEGGVYDFSHSSPRTQVFILNVLLKAFPTSLVWSLNSTYSLRV